jgi:hypothetical protein
MLTIYLKSKRKTFQSSLVSTIDTDKVGNELQQD